jgi:WD40 repeat protein
MGFRRVYVCAFASLLAIVAGPAHAQLAPAPADIVIQLGHQGGVRQIALSPDGRLLVSAGAEGAVKLWDVDSGREMRTLPGDSFAVYSVAFSPDGRSVLSAGFDKIAKLWDHETGRELRTFTGHTERIFSAAFSPDGRMIVTGSFDKTIKLWDVGTGRELRTLTGHTDRVQSVAFSPDGRQVVSGSFDKTVKLWDAETGRELRTFRGHTDAILSVKFSPDGRRVVSGARDKTVKLWETGSGRELRTFKGHTDEVSSVAFSPDGRRVVSGSGPEFHKGNDHTIRLWDADNGHQLRVFEGQTDTVNSVLFSSDGRRIVSGNGSDFSPQNASITIWDADTGLEIRTLKGREDSVRSVAFSSDGQRIVSGSNDKTIKLWDANNGHELRTFSGHSGLVLSAKFSPDGRKIVSGSADSAVKLWDTETGRELRNFKGQTNTSPLVFGIFSVAFSPDGRQVVSGCLDSTTKLWDIERGVELRTLVDRPSGIRAVAFSPDGRKIASGNGNTSTAGQPLAPAIGDGTIQLWDTGSGREIRKFGRDQVMSLAFSADGKKIASGNEDNTIKVWDTETGRELQAFKGPATGSIATPVFSRDGRLIFSGGSDIRVWDIDTGNEVRSFAAKADSFSLDISPDGKRVVSGGRSGTKIWNAQNGTLIGTAISFTDGEWVFLTPEGFFDMSSPKGAQNLSIVRGLEVSSIDQVYNVLYRPDLVREKFAGDPDGKVKAAAAKLDLTKVMASGAAPKVAIISPDTGTLADKDHIAVDATVSDQGGGVGKVEWRVNGVTLGIETRGLARVAADASSGPSKTLRVQRALTLERGENRIEVVAYNAKDLIASEPASVTVNWDGEKGATPPKLFVMAVGVNDYYDSRLKLSYAVPDATAIAEGFRKAGTGLYASVDVTTVLDSDVTISNLDKVFADIGGRVQPRDVFVFFLAGHGKTKNGRYYFLPRDFRYEDEDSIEKAGMDQDKFQAWFAKIPARKSILLYDTCESGSLTGAKTRGSDIDERLGALNRMTRATGRTFLTATTDDAPALEGYRGHGVFTYAILDALDHGDINKNGLIEVSELADYVDQKVPDISFDAFKLRQVPQRSIVGNNFALTNKAAVLGASAGPAAGGKVASAVQAGGPPPDNIVPAKPTHVVVAPADVFAATGGQGPALQQIPAGTLLSLVKTEQGWMLMAKDGKSIGYVATDHLLRLQ